MIKRTDTHLARDAFSPKHWRMRPEELRTCAESMINAEARAIALPIADDYERLALKMDATWGSANVPPSRFSGPAKQTSS
jgi:hypothetical protein